MKKAKVGDDPLLKQRSKKRQKIFCELSLNISEISAVQNNKKTDLK